MRSYIWFGFVLSMAPLMAFGQEAYRCKTANGLVYQDRPCQIRSESAANTMQGMGQRKSFAWKDRATSDCKNLVREYAKNQYIKSALLVPPKRIHELAQRHGPINFKDTPQFSTFYSSDAMLDEKTNQAFVRGKVDIMNGEREMALHAYECRYDNAGAFYREIKIEPEKGVALE